MCDKWEVPLKICKTCDPNPAEMEKAADAADISVLFFSAGANFWAVLGHFWQFWVIFGPILAILGHFWAILGNFRSFLGHFLVLIFSGKICICAI